MQTQAPPLFPEEGLNDTDDTPILGTHRLGHVCANRWRRAERKEVIKEGFLKRCAKTHLKEREE